MNRGFGYGYDDDDDVWVDGPNYPPMDNSYDDFGGPRKGFGDYRNDLYNNAYGDYRGGYGPGGGFGPPPPLFGPRSNFPGPSHGPMGPPFPPGPQFVLGRGFGPDGPPMRRTAMDEKVVKYLIRCGVAKEHLKNLPRDLLQLIEPEHCGLCAQSFDSFVMSRMHYISRNHLKNQKKWLNQQAETAYGSSPREIPLKSRDLYCELCDVHITSKTHSDSHYAGRPHRSIVEGRKNPRNPFLLQPGMEHRLEQLIRREKKCLKPLEEVEEPEDKKAESKAVQPELYCEICKTSVTCSEQMTMHLNGKRHLSKEKQHILKMMKIGANAKANQDEGDEEEYEEEGEGNEDEQQNTGNEADEDGAGNDDWANGSGNWDEPGTGAKGDQ